MSHTHTERAPHPRPAVAQSAKVTVPADAQPFLAFSTLGLLTCRQAAILMTVRANPGMTVGALAAALDLNKPAVTRAVDKLAAYKLVRRNVYRGDLRLVEVWPAGARKRG